MLVGWYNTGKKNVGMENRVALFIVDLWVTDNKKNNYCAWIKGACESSNLRPVMNFLHFSCFAFTFTGIYLFETTISVICMTEKQTATPKNCDINVTYTNALLVLYTRKVTAINYATAAARNPLRRHKANFSYILDIWWPKGNYKHSAYHALFVRCYL